MLQSLFFKEWLKIRWAALAMLGLSLLVLAKITINLAYSIRFMEANNFWNSVIFRQVIFYSWLNYIPALTGLVIGIVQFVPEISANRLKLTLHLPMPQNKILLAMSGFGLTVLLIIFLISEMALSFIVGWYFPLQVLTSVWLTTLPWFLAGFATYFATGMIITEPVWRQRIFLIIIFAVFISEMVSMPSRGGYEIFTPAIPWFFLLTLMLSFAILFSAQRFRKGVR